MDASVLIGDRFWSDPAPQVLGDLGGAMPDDERLEGHVLFTTSGSTGAPKWLALSKRALGISADAVNRHLSVGADSCWGLALPWHHVGGFGVVARARQAGCRLAISDGRWNAAGFVDWLQRENVTHTSLVPTQVHDLIAAGLRAPECLRAVVVGGGALAADAGRAARDLGWPVLASFGMTEACSQIATRTLDDLKSIYQPSPLPLLDIWRARIGLSGCLEIAGDALFSGWLIHAHGSWEYQERSDEWHATRDRVGIDGRMLTPLGRADLQVKVLGELVDLERIERELIQLAGGVIPASSLVVVALPDPRAGHRLVPVCDRQFQHELMQALQPYAAQAAGYARLAEPVVLDQLPCSDLSKPLRAECARLAMESCGPTSQGNR